MASRSGNPHLALWIAATGLSHREIARRITAAGKARGHRQVAPDATRVRRWIDGEKPRPPVPSLLTEVLSDAAGQPLTPGDLGLTGTGPELDGIQLPLLTEAAAQALAGWTQMDLFMNRRDTLKLALGAPLLLAAERMLGGGSRALSTSTKGFDADTVTALEAVTAFFTTADAAKGGGLYRSAIVAQLAVVARRIQDGVPSSLRSRVFAATADLAALAGWVSHDSGRYPTAQRYWSYGVYAAAEAGQPDRGVEVVTRMAHQMIYLGHPTDALGLLDLAAKKATMPATRALVASQTGRVHAALGNAHQAEQHLGAADDLLINGLGDDVPEWVAYFDAAEHAGARAVSARDLAGLRHGSRTASVHFEDALKLRKPGFDRVKVMDRVGLAAALFDEGDPERGAAAAHQALDDAARVDSTLVTSRLNTLLNAARPYESTAVEDVRSRARELATTRPTTIAA
ncbi:Tat pathway signal protein [Streptomyces ipomoeae]|uniref:Tat pathway signal protein n=1 Tax=Streptomyces ipomoeae TaxID=103232 RepID=UPI0029B28677|nr:Tat pathway signal protein [Streptomyces ipomoeae]MDX2695647.1 Tat pathway signal protein [Streptomyces ipomoeae]MDX2841618.1 Tat pathway signal protein [Streptomyces ipomoeae]